MTAILMVPMVVMAGGGIDLVAQERLRATLQDGLDRGVLAAAALSQKTEPRTTIESYLKSVVSLTDYDLDVTATSATNAKNVKATITARINTHFLQLIGIDELSIVAHSEAEEKRSNIEISLLLDVSGSMRFNEKNKFEGLNAGMRITALRPAAKGFIDTVLSDEAKDYTTVSVVPYAGQVSVGPTIFNALSNHRTHDRSSCFEFAASDFTRGMPNFANLAQTQQFTKSNHHDSLSADEEKITEPWWCPDDPHGARSASAIDYVPGEGADTDRTDITLLSNDRELLKKRIERYKLYDGTGTPIAMKWGFLLLDPDLQPYLKTAMQYGPIASELAIKPRFQDRPARFDDKNTKKFIVLMTDGAISFQPRPTDSAPIQYAKDTPTKDVFSANDAEGFTQKLCDEADNLGITIFTIGFDVTGNAEKQMKNCASDDDYYYPVNALNIDDAFQSIATAIQMIKLLS